MQVPDKRLTGSWLVVIQFSRSKTTFCYLFGGEDGVSATKGRGRLDELLLSAPRQEIFRWQHCRGQKFVRDQAFAIPVNLWIAKSVPSGEGMAHSIESTESLSSFISK